MSGGRAAIVAALTLAVSALTLSARADEAPAPLAPAAPAGTPLGVRTARPLELAPAPSGSRVGTGLTLAVAALGAGAWLWKRRKPAGPPRRAPALDITARRTIGVRSELLIVEVEGQSLLLGVTPGAIHRLAVLPDVLAEKAERADLLDHEAFEAHMPRLAREPLEARPIPRRRPDGRRDSAIEEQVRGLARVRREP